MIEANAERLVSRLVPHHIPPIRSKQTPTFLVLVILFVLLLRCWCLYPRGFGVWVWLAWFGYWVFFNFRHYFSPTNQETRQGKSWSTKAARNIMNASVHFLMQCMIPWLLLPFISHL